MDAACQHRVRNKEIAYQPQGLALHLVKGEVTLSLR